MHARLVIIAAATFIGGSAFAAEPAKPPVHQSEQADAHPAQIVLASAESIDPAAPAAEQQAQPAPRRARVARVTSCRCGGQEGQEDQADQ